MNDINMQELIDSLNDVDVNVVVDKLTTEISRLNKELAISRAREDKLLQVLQTRLNQPPDPV